MKYLKAFSPSHGILDNSKEVFFFFWERAFLFKSRVIPEFNWLWFPAFLVFRSQGPLETSSPVHPFIRSGRLARKITSELFGSWHPLSKVKDKDICYIFGKQRDMKYHILSSQPTGKLFAVQPDQTNMARPIWHLKFSWKFLTVFPESLPNPFASKTLEHAWFAFSISRSKPAWIVLLLLTQYIKFSHM